MPHRVFYLAAALSFVAAAGGAAAQPDAQALRSRSLAATCAACHGTDGRAPESGAMPRLAGLQAPYLAEQLKAFRSGMRAGTVMPQLAKGYSDAQIERLAAYFAALPNKP